MDPAQCARRLRWRDFSRGKSGSNQRLIENARSPSLARCLLLLRDTLHLIRRVRRVFLGALPQSVNSRDSTAPSFLNETRTRVLLIEDHPMVRQGMRSLLEGTSDFIVCAEVGNADDALAAIVRERPDVICLDLLLGEGDGFELIRTIRAAHPNARILVLSVRDEELFAERCIQAGALGYAMKTEPNAALLAGLRRVSNGDVYLSARAATRLLTRVNESPGPRSGLAGLSDRELQVFQLIGLGLPTRQIAERLGISIKTVETHRENLKNKLGFEHSTRLVREAMRWVQRST
jgi:DNA-binding NarL/FixJ family response regulator